MAKNPRVQIIVDGKDNTKQAFGAVSKSLASLEKKTAAVGRAMVGSFAGIISVATLKKIGELNSEWVDMSSRLRRVTVDEEEFTKVTAQLGEVAESTWTGLNETIESYLELQGPLADMGLTTQQQVNFVSALNNALVVSGAKKEVAASVQNALNQAMALGVLRGQNLNTVISKGGRVAELLAQELGITTSELLKVGAQGQITGDIIYSALAENVRLLSEEAEAMPATFEDAMQRVNESIVGAFRDDELLVPLTDSLLELAAVIKDPTTQQGINVLAAALVRLGAAGVQGVSEFGLLGQELGYLAANATGSITELDKLEAQIRDVNRSINNTGLNTTLGGLWYSKEELIEQRKNLEKQREVIINEMTGTTTEIRKKEEERAQMLAEQKEKEAAIQRKYVSDIKKYGELAVKEAVKRGKDLAKAEAKALSEVEKAKKGVQSVKDDFNDIRKDMAKGSGQPDFSDYQTLALSAKKALAAGDTKRAREDALAAAEVLRDLQAAGENTYGFGGMVNALEKISLAAANVEQANAEQALEAIKLEMTELAEQAKDLEDMPITFKLDDAEIETIKTQIEALLNKLKVDAVIPVRLAAGDLPKSETAPGFANGGWTGPGSKYKAAGLVHADEHVQPKRIVREPGALQFLEEIRRNGFRNTINRIKGYAEGGLVGASYNAPNISQSLLESPQQKNIGTLNFNLPGGESFSVDVAGTNSMDDLHRAALKFGRTRR